MSIPSPPTPVKLVVSLILSDRELFVPVSRECYRAFGRIDFMSRFLPFTTTTYYHQEMGINLVRRFIAFKKLIEPSTLPEVKRWTDGLESRYKDSEGRRKVNSDPGYLSLDHLLLATHKKYTHRPYLREGTYADLTLIYQKKSFHPLAWTYPDYGSAELITMMNQLRERYRAQLKETKDKDEQ